MAIARALRRLLRIREIEEEQSLQALEKTMAELHRLRQALAAASARERRGRTLVSESAQTGETVSRLAGIEESRLAARQAVALRSWIAEMEIEVAERRQKFLSRRVERRQVETLLQEAAARQAVEYERHAQQALDEWHRSRHRRRQSGGSLTDPAEAADCLQRQSIPETVRPQET